LEQEFAGILEVGGYGTGENDLHTHMNPYGPSNSHCVVPCILARLIQRQPDIDGQWEGRSALNLDTLPRQVDGGRLYHSARMPAFCM